MALTAHLPFQFDESWRGIAILGDVTQNGTSVIATSSKETIDKSSIRSYGSISKSRTAFALLRYFRQLSECTEYVGLDKLYLSQITAEHVDLTLAQAQS